MSERREATRKRVYIGGRIVHRFIRSDTACLLRDLSPGGARVIVSGTILLPDRFEIVVESRGTTQSVEAVWRSGDAIGVRFVTDAPERGGTGTHELEQSRIELALLRARIAAMEKQARPAEWSLH